jgi:hypothetical protein
VKRFDSLRVSNRRRWCCCHACEDHATAAPVTAAVDRRPLVPNARKIGQGSLGEKPPGALDPTRLHMLLWLVTEFFWYFEKPVLPIGTRRRGTSSLHRLTRNNDGRLPQKRERPRNRGRSTSHSWLGCGQRRRLGHALWGTAAGLRPIRGSSLW